MKYGFYCENCDSKNLRLNFVVVTKKHTFLNLTCLDCEAEAAVDITEVEAQAIGNTKIPKKKPNGGVS